LPLIFHAKRYADLEILEKTEVVIPVNPSYIRGVAKREGQA
jgi:hypothetical protein